MKLLKMKLVPESINELTQFTRGNDDKMKSLNIGKRSLITSWLNEMNIKDYFINDDLTIDIKDDVIYFSDNFINFPDYINININNLIVKKLVIKYRNFIKEHDIINAINVNPFRALRYTLISNDENYLNIFINKKNNYIKNINNALFISLSESEYSYITSTDTLIKMMDIFIDKTNINKQDSKGNTLAIYSIIGSQNGNLPVLSYLINKGINLNIKNNRDKTVFEYSHKSTSITKYLNQFKTKSGYTDKEFITANKNLDYKLIKEILNSGFKNVNAINNLGNTVLITDLQKISGVKFKKIPQIIELLINNGINVNYVNPKDKQTALSTLVREYSYFKEYNLFNNNNPYNNKNYNQIKQVIIEIFNLLMKAGANTNSESIDKTMFINLKKETK